MENKNNVQNINIIGAGLAGLSAAITLAEHNIPSNLFSLQPSERAQSVLAEGGINGALNTMGEEDAPQYHREDTLRAGVYLADEEAVRGLTEEAPQIIRDLERLGVAFNTQNNEILLRNFGGQKKKRTAYARSSTGKIIMTALIDEARRYEARGLITRYPHHELVSLLLAGESEKICCGVLMRNTYTTRLRGFAGPVILAIGGMNGVFPELTTGTTSNSGDALAQMFAQGVRLGNLEMIQYHPTTIGISGKRCLVTEAARGEGGRLYVMRNGERWYFMEEKYPELKNLMPRDVVSREMYFVRQDPACGDQVYLDLTGLAEEVWRKRLPDLRAELLHYLSLDPKTDPIPVEPGIHYFMGGIDVDREHRTNIAHLYAAGECCDQYHGANRLGGNSMLGAIYGGRVAARTVAASIPELAGDQLQELFCNADLHEEIRNQYAQEASPQIILEIRDILVPAMAIVRSEQSLKSAEEKLARLLEREGLHEREKHRIYLAQAMVASAMFRRESRGAHYREDYPQRDDQFCGLTQAELTQGTDIHMQITCRSGSRQIRETS
ncbi:MAG: FAD-binding protein [Lachnospiraceae bacterium]|nr:FAD-binding protein [Lachnospiraceae bacterium]